MKAKEFKTTYSKDAYKVSGQTYYTGLKSRNDLDTKINEFFYQNPDIKILHLKYRKDRALIIYKN